MTSPDPTKADLEAALFEPSARVDAYLSDTIATLGFSPKLAQAVAYALLGGGKRLRPVLAWWCSEAVGGRGADSLPAAGAVELIHAFSLVHDDLPAIDNDDLRRGKPTLHRHSGEAMAILAGDAMLAAAFEVLAKAPLPGATPQEPDGPERVRAALVRDLTQATLSMIVGQVYDTLGGLPAGLDEASKLRLIHANKTGALIAAACRMGARCGLSPAPGAEALAAIDAYGTAIGLMFQIVDDLIDVTQDASHAGKRTGKDAAAGKATYPGALGIEPSREAVERLRGEALRALSGLGERAENLRRLADFLASRTK